MDDKDKQPRAQMQKRLSEQKQALATMEQDNLHRPGEPVNETTEAAIAETKAEIADLEHKLGQAG